MFNSEIYKNRRKKLKGLMSSGIGLFPGNTEIAMNYSANPYHFRQDSVFLYFFGLPVPGLAGVIDFESGADYIFGNDVEIDDIIWMGPQPSVNDQALRAGVEKTSGMESLTVFIKEALLKGRKIHFVPPYHGETKISLGSLINENPSKIRSLASEELIRGIVALRSVKEACELDEIEKAVAIAYEMHVSAMRMCIPGESEQNIFGIVEGIALSMGNGPSFPIILSINGQTLHNHSHNNILKAGRMMVLDGGAESDLHYASDITRTTPVGGKFSSRQKDIYEIVLKANTTAISAAAPGISNKDLHLMACRVIASGMKDLGLMKGDTDEAVKAGAHALFMPHGLGHMLGLDVHDMEGLGENFVGYSDNVKRSDQFGLAYLRFALQFKPGHVLTVEPGCYFIPELIDLWRSQDKHSDFINYAKVDAYRDFGGVRIEDNIVITESGNRVLGKPIPKTVKEIEAVCL